MLTKDEITALACKGLLSDRDIDSLLVSLLSYLRINDRQADLLKQALGEVDTLRRRVEFYRNCYVKLEE